MFPAVLIQVIIVLVIAGLILWAISQFPLDPTLTKIIRVLVIVFVVLWALSLLMGMVGWGPYFPAVRR